MDRIYIDGLSSILRRKDLDIDSCGISKVEYFQYIIVGVSLNHIRTKNHRTTALRNRQCNDYGHQ